MSFYQAYTPSTGNRVYTAWDDFEILNETHVGIAVVDLTPQSGRYFWANETNLAILNTTLEQLLQLDLYNGISEAEMVMYKRIYEVVQLEKKCFHAKKKQTISSNGVQVTGFLHVRPVRTRIPGFVEERTLCLMTIIPLQREDEDTKMLKLSKELLTMSFDKEGELLHANPPAEDFYCRTSAHGKRLVNGGVRLDDVFASCVWPQVRQPRLLTVVTCLCMREFLTWYFRLRRGDHVRFDCCRRHSIRRHSAESRK